MIRSLPRVYQDELDLLALQYGQPLVRTVELTTNKKFNPLNKKDRFGEVCMVIRRQDGRLLTMKKTYYPHDAYRLPTGGIRQGELIFDALLRETYEETGLEVSINRFLAIATYYLSQADPTPVFYTFAFLVDEIGGTFGPVDEGEQVEAFREITPHDLPSIAKSLDQLQAGYSREITGTWEDWGQFRAAIHHLVWEALLAKTAPQSNGTVDRTS